MITAIWFDPHFGNGGPADDSGSDRKKVRMRAHAEANGATEHIWGGDVMEFDQFKYRKIKKAHGRFLNVIKDDE
ncbi:unnamed protein product, partial [marine sediment metagenome]